MSALCDRVVVQSLRCRPSSRFLEPSLKSSLLEEDPQPPSNTSPELAAVPGSLDPSLLGDYPYQTSPSPAPYATSIAPATAIDPFYGHPYPLQPVGRNPPLDFLHVLIQALRSSTIISTTNYPPLYRLLLRRTDCSFLILSGKIFNGDQTPSASHPLLLDWHSPKKFTHITLWFL